MERFGGEDRPGFDWEERIDIKYIHKKEKNKDDKNDNENNMTSSGKWG